MQVLGSILRFLFAWIDGIVAKVITLVYNLLMDLANLTLYSENIVKVIGQRIGILLGIFMLFRLSVSLINYMISPERFSDNKQGGGALIKNLDKLLSIETGMPVYIADQPLECVVRGTGKVLEELERLKPVLINNRKRRKNV